MNNNTDVIIKQGTDQHKCTNTHLQFIYQSVIELFRTNNNNNSSEMCKMEMYYSTRSHSLSQLLSNEFGGDWVVIMGKQQEQSGSLFSYYIPSIRHTCLLLNDIHFIYCAQIFEPHKPSSSSSSSLDQQQQR